MQISLLEEKNANYRDLEVMLHIERGFWKNGVRYICGIDEAGRGPLAGPVVAAAVIFPSTVAIPGIYDSKKLTPRQREDLYDEIRGTALSWATGTVSHEEIDRTNILKASLKAMQGAVSRLTVKPEHFVVDGNVLPDIPCPGNAIVRGDQRCYSIAAASILAKVTRDRIMMEYDAVYPLYGFSRHKGYGTQAHVEAIRKYGYCPIHRRSFHLKALEEK